MAEFRFRKSRRVALVALGIGLAGLAAVLAVDLLRKPMVIFVVAVAILAGLAAWLDRRVKLALSEAGIRYSGWGPAVVPWDEFSGYRWTSWRGQPYLQLFPRRPTELVAGFSPVGRLNHACAGWLRMPRFSVAAAGLDAPVAVLNELVARRLPEQPVAME